MDRPTIGRMGRKKTNANRGRVFGPATLTVCQSIIPADVASSFVGKTESTPQRIGLTRHYKITQSQEPHSANSSLPIHHPPARTDRGRKALTSPKQTRGLRPRGSAGNRSQGGLSIAGPSAPHRRVDAARRHVLLSAVGPLHARQTLQLPHRRDVVLDAQVEEAVGPGLPRGRVARHDRVGGHGAARREGFGIGRMVRSGGVPMLGRGGQGEDDGKDDQA